jgi:hypothetical protein
MLARAFNTSERSGVTVQLEMADVERLAAD